MSGVGKEQDFDFTVDKNNLYREEAVTDLKVASIRRLIPVTADGANDPSRAPIFVGHTQLMSPEGPLPLQSRLSAGNLEEALNQFPQAMQQALSEVIEKLKKIKQQQQQNQRGNDSRIIVPGR